MSAPFRERFEAMVEALRADARVQVFAAELRPPASSTALENAEQAIQRALPAAMRGFYEAHDGVFLSWGLKGRDYPELEPFGFPDYGAAPGCINILPVEMAMSRIWQKESHLNEVDQKCWKALFGRKFMSFSSSAARLSYAARNLDPDQAETETEFRAFDEELVKFDAFHVPDAVMLDKFSKNNVAALLLGPIIGRPAEGTDKGAYKAEEPLVIRATDGGADMISNAMSFEAYLDCVLASYGAAREGFYVHDQPTRIEPTKAPSLESVIAEVERDSE